jgi:hypothetical protein
VYQFVKRDSHKQQLFMRARVFFQAATIASLLAYAALRKEDPKPPH